MADMVGKRRACDDKCGCPSPCAGDNSCKCSSGSGGSLGMEHKQCSCGQHCGCNPCSCSKAETTGTGKAFCKCGKGCNCSTCAA